MKKTSTILAILVLFVCSAHLHADEFSEHFISTRAGVVNYLEGRPQVFFGNEIKVTAPRGQVKAGDTIKTGVEDRLEILLNPGSYLRIGFNSELRVVETGFNAMHFQLLRGSAIVESATFNRKVHALRIGTPAGDLIFEKAGLYRLEVQPSAVYSAIHEGKVKWMKNGVQVATLKSGKRFILAVPAPGGELQFAKLDKKDADELDRWSRRRAEFLVAANGRMSPWLRSGLDSLSYRYGYSQRGGWMFNPYFGCYTFVPFDGTFGSPYGFTYGMFLPVRIYRTNPDYGWAGAGTGGGGYNRPSAPMTTYDQRGAAMSAPSAPAARVDSGAAAQESRSSTLGNIRNR
jgi:hypothetical protein